MEKLNRREFMKTAAGSILEAAIIDLSLEKAGSIEFPSRDNIAETIEKLLKGSEATTTQMFEDEKGIIACTIEFVLADNETAALSYIRKGRHEVIKGSSSAKTNIDVTFWDSGRLVGGANIAEYKNGEWQIDEDVLNDFKL